LSQIPFKHALLVLGLLDNGRQRFRIGLLGGGQRALRFTLKGSQNGAVDNLIAGQKRAHFLQAAIGPGKMRARAELGGEGQGGDNVLRRSLHRIQPAAR
jgi:hypothetical protein